MQSSPLNKNSAQRPASTLLFRQAANDGRDILNHEEPAPCCPVWNSISPRIRPGHGHALSLALNIHLLDAPRAK
jgi:hypothetical protein